ncbi:hypothetical protein [Streptomyces luteireticuli]|uniref:DUF998 domain-containing protein n=1 Tax=Streptomyces luteireticuli TaxID=173858 RepID=A0ABN0YZW6_9ACTN
MTTNLRDIRIAGWAGIVAFVTGALAAFLTGTPLQPYPSWAWTDQRIANHFAAQRFDVALQFYSANIGFVLLLVVAAGVKRVVLRDSPPSLYTTLIVPCAAAVSLTLVATNGFWWTAALRGLPPGSARLAYELAISFGYNGTFCFGALMFFCTGRAMRRGDAFPRWLATATTWAALPVLSGDLFLMAGTGPLAPTTLLSLGPYLLVYVWLLVTGIVLLRLPHGRSLGELPPIPPGEGDIGWHARTPPQPTARPSHGTPLGALPWRCGRDSGRCSSSHRQWCSAGGSPTAACARHPVSVTPSRPARPSPSTSPRGWWPRPSPPSGC